MMVGAASGRSERGSSAVELALVLPIFLILVFGVIQYGLYFYSYQTGTYAVQQVTRRLSVGDCGTLGQQQNYLYVKLKSASTVASAAALSPDVKYQHTDAANVVTTVTQATAGVGDTVTLSLTYQAYNMNFPFIPLPAGGTVTRKSSAMVEDTIQSGVC
jgi:Flp pilus assembly protein TadG